MDAIELELRYEDELHTARDDNPPWRNEGQAPARSRGRPRDVLVFTTQDAYATHERRLETLVAPVRAHYQSAADRERRGSDLRGDALLERQLRDPLQEEYRFADDIVMSEDQEWSPRVLLAGMTIA